MDEAGITATTSAAIFNVSEDVYDLSKIRLGRTLNFVYDKKSNEFLKLIYQIDSEEEVHVEKRDGLWVAERIEIPYEIKIKTSEGVIETSMYEEAMKKGIDERAIIELANVFQWSVDFAMDPRVGDTFKFIYEERYLNGEYKMPGKVLAGTFINDGNPYYAFYYEESEENIGYFDEDANSVQKMFLKAPVAFKYISSGFTTGRRYVEAFNVSTGHRAIDYAAAYGTPVRSVGAGTVVRAGWNGSYGNFVSIHHNGTYTTNYAHLSRFAVSYGQKVEQGQTIGYVGSTGFSTGPHLHYEMVKHGVKINPFYEALPPGKAIADENKDDFFEKIKDWKNNL